MVFQPYIYQRHELAEPDWRRFPGWAGVSASSGNPRVAARALCQEHPSAEAGHRAGARRAVLLRPRARPARAGHHVDADPAADAQHHGVRRGTGRARLHRGVLCRPDSPVHDAGVQRPRTDWPSHPHAERDSLHESDMWVVEGLTHRYPTKVLAELLPTCPQYCGHCTRMDLVGNATATTGKHKLLWPAPTGSAMLDYLRPTPDVRDVVVSGGDVANVPWPRLEVRVLAARDRHDPRHPAGQ